MNIFSAKFKWMPTVLKKTKGFTLIELLIVVAIIAILVSIGAVSFSRVQRQGRDTQRQADLQEVASALEQYYSNHNSYPDNSGSYQIDCEGTVISWGAGSDFACGSNTYLADLPGDPSGSNPYRYQALHIDGVTDCTEATHDCQRFILSAKLEREDKDTPNLGCDITAVLSASDYDLCVTNP